MYIRHKCRSGVVIAILHIMPLSSFSCGTEASSCTLLHTVKHLLRVLLRLVGSLRVVQVGLVAADAASR